MNRWTDERTNQWTEGQTLLWRCKDAFKIGQTNTQTSGPMNQQDFLWRGENASNHNYCHGQK